MLGRFVVAPHRGASCDADARRGSSRSHRRADTRQSARRAARVRGVRKAFKGVQALDGVDLEVRGGEILGAGRAERLGQVDAHQRGERPLPRPTAGRSASTGSELAGMPAHRIARAGIARTYQIPRPFAHLTRAARTSRCRRCSARRRWTARAARARGVALARVHGPRRAKPHALPARPEPAPAQVPGARARARLAAAAAASWTRCCRA